MIIIIIITSIICRKEGRARHTPGSDDAVEQHNSTCSSDRNYTEKPTVCKVSRGAFSGRTKRCGGRRTAWRANCVARKNDFSAKPEMGEPEPESERARHWKYHLEKGRRGV